jgi:hypothetical protein
MHMSGVDFPNPLVEAHAAGELVIFVGAGASIPPPSVLPSFKRLVEEICKQSKLEHVFGDLDGLPLDEVLGQIADDYGIDVHERVYELTNRIGSRPSPVHKAIVNLASASTIRIVTTNYDRHLSTLLDGIDREVAEYLAPALPMGDDFSGIVYIHGRLDQERRRLIATDDDFGKAYLTDAWAARFLDRMFATRPVLFVGYSHRDTIMKYLARGLGGRSEKRYVLTDDAESLLWRQLGITPIQCSHGYIATALNDWATKASGGLLGHRARVKALVAGQDPSPVPESMSYLESIVADKSTVRFFTANARGKLWLQWVATRPEFATLFYPTLTVDPDITRELANWFADNYITDDELSDAALAIVAEARTYPGYDLSFAICRQLTMRTWPLPERVRRWLLVITNSPDSRFTTSFLGSILSPSALTADPDTALFLFDYLAEPRIRLSYGFFGGTFEPVTRDDDVSLRDTWNQTFRPVLAAYAAQLLDIVDRHLRQADAHLTIASESDRQRPSTWRDAIRTVEDYQLSTPLGFLIDAARECIEDLLTSQDPRGDARLESWATSGVALLHRLAVHGWTYRPDKTPTEKIQWFRNTGWLRTYGMRSEATYLITQTVGSADTDTGNALIDDILAHSEDDQWAPRWAYNLLRMIDTEAPHNESVRQALSSLTAEHPNLAVENGNGAKKKESAWDAAPPTSIEELHNKIQQDLDVTIKALIACEAESTSFDDQRKWDHLAGSISAMVQQWPNDGFEVVDSVGSGHPAIDIAVVRGWAMTQPDADLAAQIVMRIASLELGPILGHATAMLSGFALLGSQSANWFMFPESEDLAKKCWETIDPSTESAISNSDDFAMEATNHPAGHLAQFWVDRVSYLWSQAGDAWNRIPPDEADYLAELIAHDSKRSQAVETVFGSNLVFFHQADRDWCNQYVWPRFDWSDETRARRLWDGYLSHGGWTKQLLADGLLNGLIRSVGHSDSLGRRARYIPLLLARLAVEADIDPQSWFPDLLVAGSTDDWVAWADAISHELSSLEPQLVEKQWDRWIRDYIDGRIRSVPRQLDPREASAMARWVLFLTDSMTDAIDLLLRVESAGFELHNPFFHDLHDAQIERAPEKVAQLVEHVMKATPAPFHNASDLMKAYAKFKDCGVSGDTLHEIAEAAMHLGIELE